MAGKWLFNLRHWRCRRALETLVEKVLVVLFHRHLELRARAKLATASARSCNTVDTINTHKEPACTF
jgi:hypothetical protein